MTTRRLAADVVGFSKLVGEDEAGTLSALRYMRREIVNPLLTEVAWHSNPEVRYRVRSEVYRKDYLDDAFSMRDAQKAT